MDAAERVFWVEGFAGASIERLSRAMRVPRASLYQQHGDKEGLFLAAVERYASTRLAPLADRLGPRGSLRDDLTAFFEAIIELATADTDARGCLISCVLADAAGANARMRDELERRYFAFESRIEARLCHDDPGLTPALAGPRAILIASLARGLMLRARAGASRKILTTVAAGAIDLLAPERRH